MDDLGVKTPNKQYSDTIECSEMVRDSLQGECVIKRADKIKKYLPNPCDHIKDKAERDMRYKRYANSAEYDDIPAHTMESLVGAIFRMPPDYNDIPTTMQYLIDDADGDGLTLDDMLRICASEMLSQNYLGGLVEYSDLSTMGLEDEQVTVAQARELGLRPSIKLYPRESIIDWNFRRVGGVLQLSYIVLKECEEVQKKGRFDTEKVYSYLVLGLDADGEYYQQKYTEIDEGVWSDIYYPQANGANLDFIPFEFCISDNVPKGKIPYRLGYLASICSKTMHRFRMSADMKECMYMNGAPITYSSGWDEQSLNLYKEMTGNDYISTAPASHVPIPDGGQFGLLSWDSSASAYADYMERNEKEIRALGGKYETSEDDGAQETATASIIKAAEKNGALTNVVNNLEEFIIKMIQYCAVFNGEEFTGAVALNKEFYKHKLTPQERTNILAEWQSGLISTQEALNQLEKGGVLTQDAQALIDEAQNLGE